MGRFRRALARAADSLLDPTIALSFDRTGFQRHAIRFREADLDVDLRGRICLVTGANSGIGRATALGLARLGAEVRLLCRNPERGRQATESIRAESGNDRVRLEVVDLSEQASIRGFVAGLDTARVDVLIHNAGVLPDTREHTTDGIERTLATNLVGPFLMTRLLLPRLVRSEADIGQHGTARVVLVSSGGMYAKRLDVDALANEEGAFDGVAAYARTKRAMVVLGEEMAARLRSDGVVVHTMHPGWADTPGVKGSLPGFHRLTRHVLRTPEQGADTVVWLAACPRLGEVASSGRFWFDRRARSTHLIPGRREPPAERDRLWEQLEHWSGVHWPAPTDRAMR